MKTRISLAVVSATALLALPVWAQTCKYMDQDGNITYSNVPLKNAKRITCFEPPPPAPPAAPPSPQPVISPEERPATPRTATSTTPAKGADARMRALQDRLAQAEQALDEARRALTEQEEVRYGNEKNYQRYLDRIKPYQDAVIEQERKIASIRKELGEAR